METCNLCFAKFDTRFERAEHFEEVHRFILEKIIGEQKKFNEWCFTSSLRPGSIFLDRVLAMTGSQEEVVDLTKEDGESTLLDTPGASSPSVDEYRKTTRFPCGALATEAQCPCSICWEAGRAVDVAPVLPVSAVALKAAMISSSIARPMAAAAALA